MRWNNCIIIAKQPKLWYIKGIIIFSSYNNLLYLAFNSSYVLIKEALNALEMSIVGIFNHSGNGGEHKQSGHIISFMLLRTLKEELAVCQHLAWRHFLTFIVFCSILKPPQIYYLRRKHISDFIFSNCQLLAFGEVQYSFRV